MNARNKIRITAAITVSALEIELFQSKKKITIENSSKTSIWKRTRFGYRFWQIIFSIQ